MEIISEEIVEQTWKEIGVLGVEDVPDWIKDFNEFQPELCVYLLAIDEELFNQDEREILFYLGFVIYKIMSKGNKPLKKVSLKAIEAAEQKNWDMAGYLAGETKDAEFEKEMAGIIGKYNQKNVWRYITEALVEDDPDDGDLRESSKGPMFIYLKTVLDCLDQ
ncbi:MAG: hypothetical protein ABII74_03840 [Elusimicrobiota bacterium]